MSGPQPPAEPRPAGASHQRPSAVRTTAFRDGSIAASDFAVDEVSDHLAQPATVVWIDLCRPTTAQLDSIAEELGLHDLAVEDALESHQRPKLDSYQSHLFLSCYAVRLDAEQGGLDGTRIDAFIGDRWLVTVRQNEQFPLESLLARGDRSADLARHGVSFLVYGLLDEVVESYFEVVAAFDDFYEEVSEGIFRDEPLDPARQRNWFEMRQALQRFHRLVTPMREVINGVMRRDHGAVPPELYPYYQDVYDHILRVVESTDALRELVATIVETNLSLRDYRQNQIMKKVTSWAAIIAVPTLVTGYYGMNVPYPGFARHWGFLASTVLMAICSLTLYVIFKRRDWL
ncbi:MAG: magnesium transporter CorA family protein [Microthrixaceae bacterium]